jgi:3-hydroxyisobutyrate dehydrogenase-like beta-hydroxyacid dehydrogenase
MGDQGLTRIGIVGVGKMGAPMARRLLAARYQVLAYDVRPEAVVEVNHHGAASCDSLAAVASGSDAVITMLPDPPAVECAVFGERGLGTAMHAGQALIEMTSSHPATTRKVAAHLGARGVRVLDAPVSGGVRGAVEGTLCIMVGGPVDLLEVCRPVLACLGRDIVHVGDAPGDGDTAKTINNLLSATAVWSVAETLALGARAGLSQARLFEAVNRSTGRSYTTETKVNQYMIPRRFAAGFTVGQYLKDLRICLDLAGELRVPMPLAGTLHQLWALAAAQGMTEQDHTALVQLTERWAQGGGPHGLDRD